MASDIQRNRVAVVSTAQTSWRAAWSEAQHTELISAGASMDGNVFAPLGDISHFELIDAQG